ncbi:MAG: rhodanese-like domain-containing protein [Oscillospiraceae bacterium]|jgi:rhodanese-related sulfurtransferase|nr:rhodanese-like domain-containing protein [Oscillospiraceae bacterium]
MGIFDLFKAPNMTKGVEEFRRTEGALLIDVRSLEEYAGGHVEGSINLPVQSFGTLTAAKDTPIFVHCLSGARSSRAAKLLEKLGYTNVRDIGGLSTYKGELVK